MLFLRSLIITLVIYPFAFATMAVVFPFLLWSRRATLAALRLWALATLRFVRLVGGLRWEIRGREHIPQGAAIIAAKHQSSWETMILFVLLKDPVIVMHAKFFYFTPMGWACWRGGMLALRQSARTKSARRLLRAARKRAAEGRALCIFPEGTRRAAGAPPAYKPGVAGLYNHLGTPCVPVALNSGLFWPRHNFFKYPGTIVLEFLPPIPPGLARGAFMARLQDEIETATARLLAEGGATK